MGGIVYYTGMNADELRLKYIEFFKSKNHVQIQGKSLIPDNDPTVLFTTAGMHPLVPYLLGEKHPAGKRLVNYQKCIRTGDIDSVGDPSHLTFFEMLGNWSLGDYFKKEAIEMSFEFLTSPQWLGIPLEKIGITVFEGDETVPRDEESAQHWKKLGIPEERISYRPRLDNWWGPAGATGPCGPDTEMFFDIGKEPCGKNCAPGCPCGKWLEIWNDVFMQYNKNTEGHYEPLTRTCVDTGMGIERTVTILNGKKSVYDTEIFAPIIQAVEKLSDYTYGTDPEKDISVRIICDHIRSGTFILGDPKSVSPSNVGAGYVLRRLIRRAVRHGRKLGIKEKLLSPVARVVIEQSRKPYPELTENQNFIIAEFDREEEKFLETLQKGEQEFQKLIPTLVKNPQKIISPIANIIMGEMLETYPKIAEKRSIIIAELDKREAEFIEALQKGEEMPQKVFSVIVQDPQKIFLLIAQLTIKEMEEICPELQDMSDHLDKRMRKFIEIVQKGEEEFHKHFNITQDSRKVLAGALAFKLYDTYGFPIELTEELAKEQGIIVNRIEFDEAFKKHQELSRAGSEQLFKGGLGDQGEAATKYHTATHLLHKALKIVLGDHVAQKGSNITAERMRFDFSHSAPMTKEEINLVENMVNEQIERNLPIIMEVMALDSAMTSGAIALFGEKYETQVKVYSIGDFSKEVCGGPHVEHTGTLGRFHIQKEQSSSAGVRRIRAVLE